MSLNAIEEPFSNQEVVKPPTPPVLVTFIDHHQNLNNLNFQHCQKKEQFHLALLAG